MGINKPNLNYEYAINMLLLEWFRALWSRVKLLFIIKA